jgi:hypothetical protein
MNRERHQTTQTERRFPCSKRKFSSKQEAAQHAEAMVGQERAAGSIKPGPLRPYFCDRCGVWHLGHVRTTR